MSDTDATKNAGATDDKSGGATSPKDGEKKFTQEEINAILARERRKLESELADKTAALEQADLKLKESTDKLNTLADASATAEQKETALKEGLAGILELIPEEKRALVPEKLSAEDQINYINKNKKTLFGASEIPLEKPSTPPSDRHQPEGKASDLPGGYGSLLEFADKDPKGYAKYRREQGTILR